MKNYKAWLVLVMMLSIFLGGGCIGHYSMGFGVFPYQDFYGKVIDQYGEPVSNVEITGTLVRPANGVYLHYGMMGAGDGTSGGSDGMLRIIYQTRSDSYGFFQFTGHRGTSFGVHLSRDGYEINERETYNEPVNDDKTTLIDRAVFTMWKLKGAEPMMHSKADGWIPYDGTPISFNLFTGNVSNKGDLNVTLIRNPLQIKRGKDHFDWSVQIEITGEGLVETTDSYKNLAVEGGYKPVFEFSMKKDDPHWTQKLIKDFYVHTAKDTYGRIHIDLTTDSDRSEGTGLSVEAWLNPSGSRNLEYDPAKEIEAK